MIVDGKKIADDMLGSLEHFVRERGITPRLVVLTSAPDFATQSFLRIKSRAAARVGVSVEVQEFPASVTTGEVIAALQKALPQCEGIIVQLPFPPSVDVAAILSALPASHDIDAIGDEARAQLQSGTSAVLPPVVGAIDAIARTHDVTFKGKRAVVVGAGRLVGGPAAQWLSHQGAMVTVLQKDALDIASVTKEADILVLGAGSPQLISPDMLHDGVYLFDAGTSEDGGKLVGDAQPSCATKAALFTPVPGGIGPITISVLFENLLRLGYGYEPVRGTNAGGIV